MDRPRADRTTGVRDAIRGLTRRYSETGNDAIIPLTEYPRQGTAKLARTRTDGREEASEKRLPELLELSSGVYPRLGETPILYKSSQLDYLLVSLSTPHCRDPRAPRICINFPPRRNISETKNLSEYSE